MIALPPNSPLRRPHGEEAPGQGHGPVFISYAREDGAELAGTLRQRLAALGFAIWQDVMSMRGGEKWWLQIADAIERSATMLLVLTDAALGSPIVRKEWVHARSIGTKVLPVTPDSRIFEKAPRWVREVDVFILAPGRNEEATWARLVADLESPHVREPIPFMAPSLPDHLTRRGSLEGEVFGRLLDDTRSSPRPGKVVLLGAGGFGKTTLAQAVCHDPEVLEAFSNGVLWLTVGEARPSVTGASSLVGALTGSRVSFDTAQDAFRRLHELLKDRSCLLVLDDVWDAADVTPYLGAEGCTYLITTRVADVAALADGSPLEVSEMQWQEAVDVLVNRLPLRHRPPEAERMPLVDLAARLGNWALLLGLVGGTLRAEVQRGSALSDAIDLVNQGLDEEGLTAFDAHDARDRNQALGASLAASLRRYSADERCRLLDLSVFRPGDEVPEVVAVRLWSATAALKAFSARKLLRRFAGQFFALRAGRFRFHDALREYLHGLLGSRACEVHAALLDSYNPEPKPWHEVPDDGYLYDHLTYHLRSGERHDTLARLFANQSWMHARFEQRDFTYEGYLDDLRTAEASVLPEVLRQLREGQTPAALGRCLRLALIRASINSIIQNHVPELVGQAVRVGLWSSRRALSVAARTQNEYWRLRTYRAIVESGSLGSEDRPGAVEQWLLSVCALTYDVSLTEEFATLRPHLNADLAAKALARAWQMDDSQHRASALVTLTAGLDAGRKQAVLAKALVEALALAQPAERAVTLMTLAPYLGAATGEAVAAALDAIRAVPSYSRSQVIEDIAPHFAHDSLQAHLGMFIDEWGRSSDYMGLEALGPHVKEPLVRALYDQMSRLYQGYLYSSLAAIAPQLSGEIVGEALRLTESIESDWERALARAALSVRLEGAGRTAAIDKCFDEAWAVRDIHDGFRYCDIMRHLVGEVPPERVDQALSLLAELPPDSNGQASPRAHLLALLAPRMSESQLARAVEEAAALVVDEHKAEALVALAPYLRGDLLARCVDAARGIEHDHYQATALGQMAPHLKGELLEQAVLGLEEHPRKQALQYLAPFLDRRQVAAFLNTSLEIRDREERTAFLAALFPRLQEEVKTSILGGSLEAAREEKNPLERSQIISPLAPHLPAEMVPVAFELLLKTENDMSHYFGSGLEAIAPRLDRDMVARAFRSIVQGLATGHPVLRQSRFVVSLAAIVELLDQGERREALDRVLEAGHEGDLAWGLEVLAPHLGPELRDRALAGLESRGHWTYRAWEPRAFAALLPLVDPPTRRAVLQRLCATAESFDILAHGHKTVARYLKRLAPILDADLLVRLRPQVLALAESHTDLLALACRSLDLPAEQKAELIDRALRSVLAHPGQSEWQEDLQTLAQLFSEPMLLQVLESVRRFRGDFDWVRSAALEIVIPLLSPQSHAPALEMCLSTADPRYRGQTLGVFARWLQGELFRQALEAARALPLLTPRGINAVVPVRAQTLAQFLRHAPAPTSLLRETQESIAAVIGTEEELKRQELFRICLDDETVLLFVLASGTANEIASSTIEICDRWEWL